MYEKQITDLENLKSEIDAIKEGNIDSVALLHDLIKKNFETKANMMWKDVQKEFKIVQRKKNAQKEKIEMLKRKKTLKEDLKFMKINGSKMKQKKKKLQCAKSDKQES